MPFAVFAAVFAALVALHWNLLALPFYWDEAGYFVPAALDFFRHGLLIPQSTLPTGHTPAVTFYLALAWKIFGYSARVTRVAMLVFAAGTIMSLAKLGRLVVGREAALWAATLLAVSPLFFAQSSLVQLDLPAALFTTLALVFLLQGRSKLFAVTASLAVLSKETAVVLLPVAWAFAYRRRRESTSRGAWFWLAFPALPLAAWVLYFRLAAGFWLGSSGYLQYNLYSTLRPLHIVTAFARRLYQVCFGGFNWVLAGAALIAWRWRRKTGRPAPSESQKALLEGDFRFLVAGLVAAYVILLSLLGGAVLARYLLPIFPALYLFFVIEIRRLPRRTALAVTLASAALFIAAWNINPLYPFPYEDNLAYATFIRLHERAAHFLEARPGDPRILTAWPATDELTHPYLGYVSKPLRVKAVRNFDSGSFRAVRAGSFDLLYLYSRQWQPRPNWIMEESCRQNLIAKALHCVPQIPPNVLAARYKLRILASWRRGGQWVKIYAPRNP